MLGHFCHLASNIKYILFTNTAHVMNDHKKVKLNTKIQMLLSSRST